MKKLKKALASISAVALLLTSGIQVWATESVKTGTEYDPLPQSVYPSNETSSAEHYKMQNITYTSKRDSNVKYVITTDSDSYVMMMNANSDNNGGTKSLRIYGKGKNISGTNTSAKISLFIGAKTADNKYVVSFDARRVFVDWRDYVALNEGGNDGIARFDNADTQWKKTSIGTGYDAGYNTNLAWDRYEATLTTVDAPQLNFSVSEWGVMYIDNVVVKDTAGNVIFKETFETTGAQIGDSANTEQPGEADVDSYDPFPETGVYPQVTGDTSGTHYKLQNITYTSERNEKVKYVIEAAGSAYGQMVNANSDTKSGFALRVYARSDSLEGQTKSGAKMSMFIGEPTADNTYIISFDAARKDGKDEDYVALNEVGHDGVARLNGGASQWSRTLLGTGYDAGYVFGEWNRYTATLTTDSTEPCLVFSTYNYGIMYIDNIVVWDTEGNVIFKENFEISGNAALPEFPGASTGPDAPEVDDNYDPIPKSAYPSNETSGAEHYKMQNITYTSHSNPKIKYEVTSKDSAYAMVMNADSSENGGKYSLRLYGKGHDVGGAFGSARVSFYIGEKTADNKYVISFDAYRHYTDGKDYATLNEYRWDLGARLDTTSLWSVTKIGTGYDAGYGNSGEWRHYEATLTTEEDPRLDFSVYKYGVLFLDNIIVKDTAGNIIFSEDFEVVDKIEEVPKSRIYDAEFDVVEKSGDDYKFVEDAHKLTSNTLLKASVKVESSTEELVSAVVITAFYKDDYLVTADRQVVSAAEGDAMSSTVLEIPSLDDGVYTVKVFVLDSDMNSLKNVKAISE